MNGWEAMAAPVEALCVYDVPWRSPWRLPAATAGLSILLIWFAALGYVSAAFLTTPVLGWFACAITIIVCCVMECLLSNSRPRIGQDLHLIRVKFPRSNSKRRLKCPVHGKAS